MTKVMNIHRALMVLALSVALSLTLALPAFAQDAGGAAVQAANGVKSEIGQVLPAAFGVLVLVVGAVAVAKFIRRFI